MGDATPQATETRLNVGWVRWLEGRTGPYDDIAAAQTLFSDFPDDESARTCDVTDVPVVHSALKVFVKMLNGGSEHPQEGMQTSIARCARISACDIHQPTTSMSWLHTRVHRSMQTPSLRGIVRIAQTSG